MPATTALPPKITFQRGLFAKVDSKGFSDLTIITGDTEALGHGIFVDDKSIEGLMGLLVGKSIPGYLTHEGAMFGDRLGREIGIFSGFYRDGNKLKAKQFRFLNAFMKNDAGTHEKLIELADAMPEQFGLSIVFSGRAVWAVEEGDEVDADEPRPEGALYAMPSVRFSGIESADFVKSPAANPGGLYAARVDGAGEGMPQTITVNFSGATFDSIQAWDSATHHTSGGSYWIYPDDQAGALAAKDGEIETLKASLAAKDVEHIKALAAKDSELAKVTAERDDALKFDIRRTGVRSGDLPDANTAPAIVLPEPAKTDRELWEQYHALAAKDATAAASFKEKHMGPDRYTKRR